MIFTQKLDKDLILSSFVKFIQKKGDYSKAKNIIIKLNTEIKYSLKINIDLITILEHFIKTVILPIILSHKNHSKQKYYFIIISLFKYIKKFIFIPLLKSIRSSKKYPFKYNFLKELLTIFNSDNNMVENKESIIDIFTTTNSYIYNKNKKIRSKFVLNTDYIYMYKKFKYLYRKNYNLSIKYLKPYQNINKKLINKKFIKIN